MKLIIAFVRNYPLEGAITLVALLVAGVTEGIGISALLPLLNIVMGTQSGTGVAAGTETSEIANSLEQMVRSVLGALGLSSTVSVLLLFFQETVSRDVMKCKKKTTVFHRDSLFCQRHWCLVIF